MKCFSRSFKVSPDALGPF